MFEAMSSADKEFYGNFYTDFWASIQEHFTGEADVGFKPLEDETGQKHFVHLLEHDISHISVYKYKPFSQKVFHALQDYLPQNMVDYIANRAIHNNRKWTPKIYVEKST